MDRIDFISTADAAKPTIKSGAGHWFESRAIQFHSAGRRPKTIREWLKCAYNADIFYGNIPVLKTVIAVNEIIYIIMQAIK